MSKALSANQKTFNVIARHLLRQRKRSVKGKVSVNGKPQCAYRGDNGLRCAVGCLIPNRNYDPSTEGLAAWASEVRCTMSVRHRHASSHLLQSLQNIHDYSHPNQWRKKLAGFAKNNGLTMPTNV